MGIEIRMPIVLKAFSLKKHFIAYIDSTSVFNINLQSRKNEKKVFLR